MPADDEHRRQFLLASGVALTSGLAGCSGYLEDEGGGLSGNETDLSETETERTTDVSQEIDLPVEGEAEWVEYGETVTSELTESAPRDREYNGYYEPWAFEGREGHYVTISMETGERGDPYLYLLNEAGELLTENDDEGPTMNSRIYGYELPETGSYVVLAGGYRESVDFEYDLSLREGVEGEKRDLREIAVGETAQGKVDAGDPYDEDGLGTYEPVTVQTDTSQTVEITATAERGFYLLLTDGDDAPVEYATDHNSSGRVRINAAEIDADGEYTILLIPLDQHGLEYELTVEETTTTDLRSIDVGETETGQLDGSDPESRRFNGYFEPVTLEASSDQTVDIEMSSANGDTYLYLLDSGDDVIAENDDGGRGVNSAIERVTLEGGNEYTIIATSFSSGATFEYQLSVEEAESIDHRDLRSIRFGETSRGEIDEVDPESSQFNGYYEPVTFSGEAGQAVTIEMMSDEGDCYLFLLDPDSNVIAENDDGGSGVDSAIRNQELPSSGQYSIVAASYWSSDTFEYELSLTES